MLNENWLPSGDDFSDTDTSVREFRINSSNGFLPASSPDSPVVKSPEKLESMHVDSDAGGETMLRSRKKRKSTMSSYAQSPWRIWSRDDELALLKGIVDFLNKTGVNYSSDSVAFYDYIKDAIDAKVSRNQIMSKARKLKARFLKNLKEKPVFTDSHDSDIFDASMAIWDTDAAEHVGSISNTAKETKSKAFVEHEEVAKGEPKNDDESANSEPKNDDESPNGEPENDDESANGDSFDKLPSENINKNMVNESGEKKTEEDEPVTKGKLQLPSENVDESMDEESEEDDAEEDEMCALQDAVESPIFQDLSKYAQKRMLKKLRTLEARKKKVLIGEWKSLLDEEAQLTSMKLTFSAKLINVVAALRGR